MIQACWICFPTGTLNLLLNARRLLLHSQVIPRLHNLLFCWLQASLSIDYGGLRLIIKPSCGRALTVWSKSGNPAPLLRGNLPSPSACGCQETCFPMAQKGLALPTVPNHGRAPTSPLKTKNIKFSTEGRKAVTYYSVSVTRMPASWGAQRLSAPHWPLPH
jgi:hypothetical protein